MSRLHEALKRSARHRGRDASESSSSAPASDLENQETLNEYPVEGTTPLTVTGKADRERLRPARPPVLPGVSERVTLARPQSVTPPEPLTVLVSTSTHKGSLVSLGGEHKLIVDAHVPATWVESFDGLARTLEERGKTHPRKVLFVMSADRGEGRTLTAVNLALALSERLHRRVLLVDGDVRNPSATRLFNIANGFRLSDVAKSEVRQVPVVEVSPTLSVLGTEASDIDAMQVLVSNGMKSVLLAASQYDWVLVDTPAIHSLQEAHLLAWMGDGVLLVVNAPTTRRRAAEKAVSELGGGRVVGVVLNGA